MKLMQKYLKFISLAFIAAALVACGGGSGDGDFVNDGNNGDGNQGSTSDVAAITLTTSVTSIATDGSETAVLTARARDANNVLLQSIPITFSADSGGLQGTNPAITDANGEATVTLTTGGDTTTRDIIVTATTSNGMSAQSTIAVIPSATVPVASLELITDPALIGTQGSQAATITAIVKDASNNLVEGATVNFVSDSGGIQVISNVTDANGVATASLNALGDKSNRVIQVTASTGTVSDTVNVNVGGTTLTISGPTNISISDTAEFTIVLTDSGDVGIAGEEVTITSSNGNGLSASTVTTDDQGRAVVTITGTQPGTDTVTVSGFGLDSNTILSISGDEFSFVSPAVATEVNLGASQVVTVQLVRNAVPVSGETITFSTSRGSFVGSNTAITNASGQASVTVTANNAGPAVVVATNAQSVATQTELEFVATTPTQIEVQANPFTVAANQQATIIAIVRDASQNLVKNITVDFSIFDVSGGQLSSGAAVTNSQGRAEVFYTASDTPSSTDGVEITATVNGTAITDQVNLTTTGRELFIALGTGNTIELFSTSQYAVEYAVQITDSAGAGVAGATVSMKSISQRYFKGDLFWNGDFWEASVSASCANEDVDADGILDAGEDFNNNMRLDPGNKATVSPGTVTTDASGFAYVKVVYPKEFANWLEVKLEAQASVSGTEVTEPRTFILDGAASDFDDEDVQPPGQPSPFGTSSTCADTL